MTVFGAGLMSQFKLVRSTSNKQTIVVRHLWAKGKGRFRTKAKYSSASVRGTYWLMEDRCDGSLTQVKEGVVSVYDMVKKKTINVRAGHSYLAVPRR